MCVSSIFTDQSDWIDPLLNKASLENTGGGRTNAKKATRTIITATIPTPIAIFLRKEGHCLWMLIS